MNKAQTIINGGTKDAIAFTVEKSGEMFKVRIQRMTDPSVLLGNFFGSIGYATYPKSCEARRFYTAAEAQKYIDKRVRFEKVRAKKIGDAV